MARVENGITITNTPDGLSFDRTIQNRKPGVQSTISSEIDGDFWHQTREDVTRKGYIRRITKSYKWSGNNGLRLESGEINIDEREDQGWRSIFLHHDATCTPHLLVELSREVMPNVWPIVQYGDSDLVNVYIVMNSEIPYIMELSSFARDATVTTDSDDYPVAEVKRYTIEDGEVTTGYYEFGGISFSITDYGSLLILSVTNLALKQTSKLAICKSIDSKELFDICSKNGVGWEKSLRLVRKYFKPIDDEDLDQLAPIPLQPNPAF